MATATSKTMMTRYPKIVTTAFTARLKLQRSVPSVPPRRRKPSQRINLGWMTPWPAPINTTSDKKQTKRKTTRELLLPDWIIRGPRCKPGAARSLLEIASLCID